MDLRRAPYFALGALAAILLFGLALAGVAHFVPRFLDFSRDPSHRYVIIAALAVILLMNVFRRSQRRRGAKPPPRLTKR